MKRTSQWRGARAAGLGVLVALLLACAPATRLQVLSFFFDGVPGAPGTRPEGGSSADSRNAAYYHQLRPRATPRPTPLPIISRHRPVVERRCKECHERGGMFAPIEMTQQLCDKCHREKREKGGWDHGPINMGSCVPCHRSHDSPYPHLLDKSMPDVCLTCHKDDLERGIKKHAGLGDVNQCTACHDPHRKERVQVASVADREAKARDGKTSASLSKPVDAGRMTTMTVANAAASTVTTTGKMPAARK